jgi:transcriptional regulator with XRE-family HTH domain
MEKNFIHLQSSINRLNFKLRFFRETSNLSQKDLANKLNIGHRSYQRIESGLAHCDISFLYRFCNLLQIDFNNLTSAKEPAVDENVNFFLRDESSTEKEYFKEMIPPVLEEVCSDLESNKFTLTNMLENPIFLNDIHALAVSNPFKKYFNISSNELLGLFTNDVLKKQIWGTLEEQFMFWDNIYYYTPQYSVRKNFKICAHEKSNIMTIYSIHIYKNGQITSVSWLKT